MKKGLDWTVKRMLDWKGGNMEDYLDCGASQHISDRENPS